MAGDHPLALELSSLKAALDRYQAAHTSSLQLQRAYLEASDAAAQSKLREAENARLKQEITFLRDNPEPTHTPRQVTELTLALRRISDKLSHTEGTLVQKTTELAQAMSEKMAMQHEVDITRAEVERIRQKEFESRSQERELQRKCQAAEEEARMADAVVMEYADLVRSLEDRIPKTHDTFERANDGHSSIDLTSSPQARSNYFIRSLTENRYSLQRLLHEFNSETSDLQAEIIRIHTELSATQIKLDAEREMSRQERSKLAEALVEVERYKADDATAGKIVSRYMRFSQSSIDMLQTALSTLKSRHAMTLATFSSSNEGLSQALALERRRAAQLRDILDQLTEDISRETFGRRREVALRLRGVVREERTNEALSIWLRRAEEHREKVSNTVEPSSPASPSELLTALDHMIEDAHVLHASLSCADDTISDSQGCVPWERIVLAEHACRSLLSELQEETEKRLSLTRAMGETLNVSPLALQQNITDPSMNSDQGSISREPIHIDVSRAPSPDPKNNVVYSPNPLPLSINNIAGDECQEVINISSLAGKRDGIIRPSSPDLKNNVVPSPNPPPQPINNIAGDGPQEGLNISGLPRKRDDTIRPSPTSESDDEATTMKETSVIAHPPPSPPGEAQSRGSRPFLDELTHVSHRYEELQRALRDCHLALAQLKTTVTSELFSRPDKSVLRNVVHRLDDFCEDARVELEIRMGDEERIAQGYETMLRVPGALAVGNGDEARRELESFLDGTAPTIIKTRETYTTKLTDLQHDIAQVKRAIHELEASFQTHVQPTKVPPIWPSWTPFLSTSPKPSSSPAPTFGTVITTPRSDRIPSFSSRSSYESLQGDLYAHLDLRIPVPSQSLANSSPLKSPKLRNTSSGRMYILGLGGSKSGFGSTQDLMPLSQGKEDDSDIQGSHSDVE